MKKTILVSIVLFHCFIENFIFCFDQELVQPKIEHLNFNQLKINLNAFNKNFILDLKPNYFLSNNYQESPKLNYGKQRKRYCHFKGNVNGDNSSFAAISFCDKLLNGMVAVNGTVYHLQSDFNNNKQVKIFTTAVPDQKFRCGFEDSKSDDIIRKKRDLENYENLFNERRFVEMVIVNDLNVYEKYSRNLDFLFERNVQIANIVNALYSQFNISIVLVGVVIWTDQNEIILSNNSSETLNNFLKYRRDKLMNQFSNDNAQLITASPFENGIVGKALKQTMCTYEYSGGVNYDYHESISLIATTIAHELGHNFGMEHDYNSCRCSVDNCIMGPSSSFPYPREWSSCSINQLKDSLKHGLDYCLMNKPKNIFKPSCGNGFIDEGEECDCGLPEFCKNKCCNSTTCKLIPNAKCATGKCCDKKTCTIISKNSEFVCRRPKSICDKAEICDGTSEHCPADKFVRDGTECLEGYAYCYKGKCETRENRCHLLWGNESKVAGYQCYQNNANGNSSGNCGYDKKTKKFIKCENKEDIICGRLHCTNRYRKLTLKFGPEGSTVISQILESQRDNITCYSAIIDLGLEDDDVGLVPNGAKCGLNSMCIHQKCVQIPTHSHDQCSHDTYSEDDDTCKSSSNMFLTFIYIIFFFILPILSLVIFLFYNHQKLSKNWFRQKAFTARDYNNRRRKKNPINSYISDPVETEFNIKPTRPAPPIPSTNLSQINNGTNVIGKKPKSNLTRPKKSPPKPPIQNINKENGPKVKDLIASFEKC